jgi:adenine-specific DNA methylase
MTTESLFLFDKIDAVARPLMPLSPASPTRRCALEDPGFPFEKISAIAELESWRKEVHRPLTHVHKWWAQRLGTVFRAILLASFTDAREDLISLFYSPSRLPKDFVVMDPFMGSGTTLGEALKLGARAIGRDVNPVASFLVGTALQLPSRERLERTFHAIERDVSQPLRHFYRALRPDGHEGEALYYFWVKELDCPSCTAAVPLFSSYVFSRHAYPSRVPEARAVCPTCGTINTIRHDAKSANCCACGQQFDPQHGPARGTKATCRKCRNEFAIAKRAREVGGLPRQRLYAKMVIARSGEKLYLSADDFDRTVCGEAQAALAARHDAFPCVEIRPGYNTNQALKYGYTHWHHMFNERQLLCLSILAERVRQIPDNVEREVFACLFSGVLEFNNMFTSFKGEGTGAVRHMFSHHILKPERTPLEANVWGTPRSSGSFSTLFESRILRAVAYAEKPTEIRVTSKNGKDASEKVVGLSESLIGQRVASSFAEFQTGARAYVSCGDSALTDLPDGVVDAVITDPPFFDNVHYSELADFFYVWLRHVLPKRQLPWQLETTRSPREVQHEESAEFARRLTAVWSECHRVLRDDGLLAFTYHHSRGDGWRCVLESLMSAGFGIVAAHPIKAEMAGATPKSQAREPIDLDVILVCRKSKRKSAKGSAPLLRSAIASATEQIDRLRASGRRLSRNDLRVIVSAQAIAVLSQSCTIELAGEAFRQLEPEIDAAICNLAGDA